jgi:hypothetical protein
MRSCRHCPMLAQKRSPCSILKSRSRRNKPKDHETSEQLQYGDLVGSIDESLQRTALTSIKMGIMDDISSPAFHRMGNPSGRRNTNSSLASCQHIGIRAISLCEECIPFNFLLWLHSSRRHMMNLEESTLAGLHFKESAP